jgi:hypothetical protein
VPLVGVDRLDSKRPHPLVLSNGEVEGPRDAARSAPRAHNEPSHPWRNADDAVLAIAHKEDRRAVVDLVEKQAGGVPFSPRQAVRKFAGLLHSYGVARVTGDAYAGLTFQQDFAEYRISYDMSRLSKSELYEELEPLLNAGEVELPDLPVLQEQLLTLVTRGAKIDHGVGGHDDHANAAAGVIRLVADWAKPEVGTIYFGSYEDWYSGYRLAQERKQGRFRSLREEAESGSWSAPCTLSAEQLRSTEPSDETVRRWEASAAAREAAAAG